MNECVKSYRGNTSKFYKTIAKLIALSIALGFPLHAWAKPKNNSDALRMAEIFKADSAREDMLNPLSTLYRGKAINPSEIATIFSDELDQKILVSARQSLTALRTVRRSRLSPEGRISFDVFQNAKEQEVRWLQPQMLAVTAVRPLNHFGGLHVEFPTLISSEGAVRYVNEGDYRRGLALQGAFVKVLDNAIAQFRLGMKSGVVETRLTVQNMLGQIDALLAQQVEQSPFYSPVLNFPDQVTKDKRPVLVDAYRASINTKVFPAYRRLRKFLADEYLPVAREAVGLSSMKGGKELYQELIVQHTTLKLNPEEVHTLGLSEVARISHEMEAVQRELGYSGPLPLFFDTIRTAPQFHPKNKDELVQGFAEVGRKVDLQIPRYFLRVPKTKLLIQPYPAYREKYEAGGSYNQGSADGIRPGIFYFNTYDLPSRFLTGIATLYLHEGAPGHHFQISLAQEDKTLPDFQRYDGNTAYVEGWALYAETLGYDMGLYKDPKQHWGTLDDEMLRAMRLVVDTGLHVKGWSREQAIDYMLSNSGMGRSDATSEVERYIANPAQALSYKIGALTIQRLRKKSETALGAKFDIRAFHNQILASGALPLPILEAKIDRWIAAQM